MIIGQVNHHNWTDVIFGYNDLSHNGLKFVIIPRHVIYNVAK